jgi:hypothetical protein
MSVTELFCQVDDFCQVFEPIYLAEQMAAGDRIRRRSGELCLSEIMTILIGFHQSHYRDFKAYYLQHVCEYRRAEFPGLVNYARFVALMPSALLPLCAYLNSRFGRCTGISFIDSTPLAVVTTRVSISSKRAIAETIIDQRKNISQIEHTRHRSPTNFLVNLVCDLIAYSHQPVKPSLDLANPNLFCPLIQN